MTEAEWLAATDLRIMFEALNCLSLPPTERKWRLLLVGCARRAWDRIPDGPRREAVEAAERYADGGMTEEELRAIGQAYWKTDDWLRASGPNGFRVHSLAYAATALPQRISKPHLSTRWVGLLALAPEEVIRVVRCVIGNPYRTVVGSTPVVSAHAVAVAVAQRMYDARDFAAMPILADALQDAGCEDEQVLAHCRGGGPHVRGCWVVDEVLGKG